MSKISIIIITYNRPQDCLELLEDISRLTDIPGLLKDVIIVNNASTVSYAAVQSFIEQTPEVPFKYVASPENLGVARGRNFAGGLASGELLVFTDDDILLPDKNILPKIVLAFDKPVVGGRPTGVVSFKVLYDSTGELQVSAFPHKKFQQYKDLERFQTAYYVGCAHAFTRAAWIAGGPYPADFFYGMEEYDLSYRVLDAGYAIGYDASIVIRHKESPLGRMLKPAKLAMMWVNKSKVAWRYLPRRYFFSTAFLWSLEFFKKVGLWLGQYLFAWARVGKIPFTEKRTPVSAATLSYLKQVEARLWY